MQMMNFVWILLLRCPELVKVGAVPAHSPRPNYMSMAPIYENEFYVTTPVMERCKP
jgi:hypothetical protein